MKKIILDTDLGVDSDDAVALALLLKAEKERLCDVLAVTVSTTREGAAETVDVFTDYYGRERLPVGVMANKLPCDDLNFYTKDVKKKYNVLAKPQSAVSVMRKALAESEEAVTLVSIGPLSNVSDLLNSGADEYSPLSGVELVKAKADKYFLMGGAFKENESTCKKFDPYEWNILQDVSGARNVAERFPKETVFSPLEVGFQVFAEVRESESPLWYAMKRYAEANEMQCEKVFSRYAWDPVTVMAALEIEEWKFRLSDYGDITVDGKGGTTFNNNSVGKCRFIDVKSDLSAIQNKLNDYIKEM